MAEFLAENNACGQSLLQIISIGNSIIAEILRLKDYIPDIYRLESKADQLKYADIILDFSYLKIAEAQEQKIEESAELQDLDDEVRENYLDLLTRFYLAFESTHQYAVDLNHFIDELNRGYYIQQTLESVLQDGEGKQLMCESLYLYATMLLLLDYHVPGVVRERLLISYYRYSAAKAHGDSNIDDVCMLLRSTGFVANTTALHANTKQTNPSQYPVAYFSRFTFDQNFIDMVIGRLRCDDLYNQLAIYPHPDHRSTALSTQAAMLFVCLFFTPQTLHSQVAQMREIVDKFYADNWVVSIYMGVTVNLIDAWDDFKAAKSALAPVVDNGVKGFCLLHKEKMLKTLKQTQEILRVGVLTDDFVLQNITKILPLMRQCNVLLRWYFQHTSRSVLEFSQSSQKAQTVQQLVCTELNYQTEQLLELLLDCSQLELVVKDILRNLMSAKSERWSQFKHEALNRLNELSESFAGSRPLSKIENNPQLRQWFGEISSQVEKLNAENANVSGRTLIQLIQALEEVEEFHNLQANMQVKQYLLETREFLHRMIQIINVKEDILINMQLIGDLSYAWRLLDRDFTTIMQESIKTQPKSVIRLRAAFLKLASALEIPLLRINQSHSEDLPSVSNYYSTELANYMRKVLQIIPETMFSLLARIINLQTEVLREIPTRLDKDKLKEYAQFEDRYTIAKLTHSIAIFTEGILMMKKTLVGVIELDPKQLLEDGIRKELVRHLANALNVGLIFTTTTTKSKQQQPTAELEAKLLALAKIMDGYRRSFEYIQDYLKIHGLKILQEELTRIINYNVEKECNAFLRNKVQDWQSRYQSQTISIPSFAPLQGDPSKSNNFIGRLAHEILQCTDPKQTIFLDLKASWYEKRAPHKEILNAYFFSKVREAIGPAGLVGLDRLYSYMFAADLKRNLDKLQQNLSYDKMWLDALNSLSMELESKQFSDLNAANPSKFYNNYHNRWIKVWPTLLEWLLKLGHKQILRQQLAFELNRSSKFNSKNLESALETFNRALLNELEQPSVYTKFSDSERGNQLLVEVNDYLVFTGSYEPFEQVFLTTKSTPHVALFLFLFTIAHMSRLQFNISTRSLQAKSTKDHLDGTPLLIGLLTVLQQFHKDVKMLYLTYLCQYATVIVESNISAKNEIGVEGTIVLHFLQIFVRLAKLPRTVLSERVPTIILNQFEYLAISNKS